MSKASQRLGNGEIKALKRQRMEAAKALREKQRAEGLDTCLPARQGGATDQMRILKSQLPGLLKGLSKIKDPRNPKKVKHKLKALLIYGILMFVFHISSRREANREMTG